MVIGRLFVSALILGIALFTASCGTVYRYQHYNYDEPTIDEKNQARGERFDRRFRGMMTGSSYR